MLHPTFEQVNFEEMGNSSEPQTDREFMFELSGGIKNLTSAVENLTKEFHDFKNIKVNELIQDINSLKSWRSEWNGSWKLWILISGFISVAVGVVVTVIKLT